MPNNFKVNSLLLKPQMETVVELSKTQYTALDSPYHEQPCKNEDNYNWPECLDGLLYADRGCQDPWNIHSNISVPYCSNISKILNDYKDAYPGCHETCWDKPYMSKKSLSKIVRMDHSCAVPCSTDIYEAEILHRPRILYGLDFSFPLLFFFLGFLGLNMVRQTGHMH